MTDFCTVLEAAPPLDHGDVCRLARHGCLDIHQVEWVRTYLAANGARLLCWFQARDAESVRLVLRHQGWQMTAVHPVEVSGGKPEAAAADSGKQTVVEFVQEPPHHEALASWMDDISATLLDAGFDVSRSFASENGARLVLAVNGADADGVKDCLESADFAPEKVWASMEINPVPPKLFELPEQDRPDRAGSGRVSKAGENVDFDAVIIGAGISGIGATQKLVAMGLRTRLYESAGDVGGVWHWNRYPGARVDSETYTYAFSFSDELIKDWEWRELFSAQPEIRRYLQHVVDRFGLRRHMQFDTRVRAATFDSHRNCWLIETDGGDRVTARYLIAAAGTLSTPQLPDYPGMNTFAGDSFHTARWPAGGVDLAGKNVGVVGTGASGVQVIQTIARDVGHLTVFQRTPTYCVPQRNRPLSEGDRRRILRDWSEIMAACHESYGGFIHKFDPRSGLAVSAEERKEKFEALWEVPGFAFWFGNFADLMMNMEVNAFASEFVRQKIRERVNDPEVARKLLPDHPFGTKRVPLENGYYEVYNRENVRLVDIRETPIAQVTEKGIRTSQEEFALDVIVWATGFDAGTGPLEKIDIRGAAGIELKEKWRNGPRTFLGLLVSGFPNLFVVNGPQNAAGLCNAVRCVEQNVNWIARCIEHVRGLGLQCIEPSAAAEEKWTEHVCDVADGTVLRHMTDSWFFGANTPGKARRVNIYAAGAREYREHCEEVAQAGYPGCAIF